MAKAHLIEGLDIGTNTVRLLVVQKKPAESDLEVLDQEEEPASGVRKGVVVNFEQAARAISSCVRKSEEKLGARINDVYVSVNGSHVFTTSSHGLVSVSRADRKISQEDINRVIQNAQAFPLSANKEVLEVFPREYIIDGEKGIKEPLGMEGVRLEADILALGGFLPYLKNLTQAVLAADLQVNDRILSPLASGRAVLTNKEKELGAAVLDIGAGTTGLAVFEEGSLIHLAIFPLGANHITHDIAIGLMTEIETAEKIKIEYGSCVSRKTDKGKRVRIEKIGGEHLFAPVSFSRKTLINIIEARVCEIFEQTNRELKKIGRTATLPAGVMLTGGGAKMARIVELAKRELRLPVRLGKPEGFFPEIEDPAMATVCGLVLTGAEIEGGSEGNALSFLHDTGEWLKRLFRFFIP